MCAAERISSNRSPTGEVHFDLRHRDDRSGIDCEFGKWLVRALLDTLGTNQGTCLHRCSYLQMVATAKDGGTVTLYSSRFTVTGMSGAALPAAYRNAVTALGGATAGPPDANVSQSKICASSVLCIVA